LHPERARREDRPAILQAAEWTDGIFLNAPKPAEVRGFLGRDAIKESLRVLLHRFRNRRAELSKLRRFVSASPRADGRLPVMAVTGIGGIGKSTLLARFAMELLERSPQSALVLIDFDLARFASGDPVALTFELTRQIGAWFPAIAAPLRELRLNARQNLLSSDFASADQIQTFSLEAGTRSMSEVNYSLPRILADAKIGVDGARQLVVIMDTFEVLQGGRNEGSAGSGIRGVHAVARWAEELFFDGRLRELKVVVAGRAPISEDPVFGERLTEPELRLRGLDKRSALALLCDLGLDTKEAQMVVDAVGDPRDGSFNPMILRLAERMARKGVLRKDDLIKETAGGREILDQELVQGMLYRRILAHIGEREEDKAVAAIAHPGLVLRRVTPDLIERVLYPLLNLSEHESPSPRELFDRLRREVWLVQQSGPDSVVHRTDLRRIMLRLIDADMRSEVREIHRAAVKYYSTRRYPGLSAELAAGEAFYHRLMLMTERQAARIDPAEVRRFETSLYPTLEDLPPHVLSVVKLILDHPLSDEQGTKLPEPRRMEFILRQGERHLLNDEPYRALKLLEARTDLHPLWELRALAVTASWPEARQRELLKPQFRDPSRPAAELQEWANIGVWIRFCLGDAREAFEDAKNFLEQQYKGFRSQADLPFHLLEPLARCLNYQMVAGTHQGSVVRRKALRTSQDFLWRDLSEEHLATTSMALETTRHAVLGIREKELKPRVVFSGEALPPSIRILTELAAADLPAALIRQLRRVKNRLQALSKRASSGLILGTVARAFPKAFIVEPTHWKEGGLPFPLNLPSPEFRGPVKFALLEAFTTEGDLAVIAELAWGLLDLPAHDLQPSVFVKRAVRPGRAGHEIANLVLYLDRSTVLGRFLQTVQKERPNAAKLAMVTDAFLRWERAFQLDASTVPLPAPLGRKERRQSSDSSPTITPRLRQR
jgi:hypothetical protein